MPRLRLPLAAFGAVLLAAAAHAAPSGPAGPVGLRPVPASLGRGATLVVTLCARDAPTLCDIQRTPLYDPPALCLAPPQLVQFARPGWRIARWRCEPGS